MNIKTVFRQNYCISTYLCGMEGKKEWFEEWFDTPYYHILYQDRNHEEAENFIQTLMHFLRLPLHSEILDLACGKGRHALQLSHLNYHVTGLDLSRNSISEAKKLENERLSFLVGDMREAIPDRQFDAVLNLFTSFGYFNCQNENLSVLTSIKRMLNQNGIFVIDFMNSEKVLTEMISEEPITKGGIEFLVQKSVTNGQILKQISFTDQGKEHCYKEHVQILKLADFEQLIAASGMMLNHVFGSYNLTPFDPASSDRLLLIGSRN